MKRCFFAGRMLACIFAIPLMRGVEDVAPYNIMRKQGLALRKQDQNHGCDQKQDAENELHKPYAARVALGLAPFLEGSVKAVDQRILFPEKDEIAKNQESKTHDWQKNF